MPTLHPQVARHVRLIVLYSPQNMRRIRTPITATNCAQKATCAGQSIHFSQNEQLRLLLSHLYFESIHPFEDGNGRIGRAISEKARAQSLGRPTLTALAATILSKRKSHSLETPRTRRIPTRNKVLRVKTFTQGCVRHCWLLRCSVTFNHNQTALIYKITLALLWEL